jgi:hypothetical protein
VGRGELSFDPIALGQRTKAMDSKARVNCTLIQCLGWVVLIMQSFISMLTFIWGSHTCTTH